MGGGGYRSASKASKQVNAKQGQAALGRADRLFTLLVAQEYKTRGSISEGAISGPLFFARRNSSKRSTAIRAAFENMIKDARWAVVRKDSSMAVRFLASAAFLAVLSIPASASVISIGSTSASLCYQAADSPVEPTFAEIRICDTALNEEGLTGNDRVATHVNRGILRLRRNQIDLAISDFDRAMALDPNEPEAYLNKGAAMIKQRNPGAALGLFTMAIERRTSRPELAHFGRAIANEALGNAREAYRDYRRASELDPDWAEPRSELARFRVVRN
jgi:tetratricopeptide (TPR) repeat protein